LNANKEWASNFDSNIGGLTGHHGNLVNTTRENYIKAKANHQKGIQCLKDQFDFSPSFCKAGSGLKTKSSYVPKHEDKC
jgi:hypothetical protein